MLRGPIFLATLGLAVNVLLWSVPAQAAVGALPHLLFAQALPAFPQALASAERSAGQAPSLPNALMVLIGAESEALEVAGLGLKQPTPPDLGPRADRAGARVLDAVVIYVRAASATLDKVQGR
jgi:hypothetical protein